MSLENRAAAPLKTEAEAREPMRMSNVYLIPKLFREYPRQSLLIVVFLVLAGLAEGFGIATVMPLLSIVSGAENVEANTLGAIVFSALRGIGLETSLVNMLILIVVGMTAKAALAVLAMREVATAMAYVTSDFRLRLLNALMLARWPYFTHQASGDLANAVTTETVGAGGAFWSATRICTMGLQVLVFMVLALAVSWEVTIAAVIAGAALFVSLNFLVGIARRAGVETKTAFSSLVSRLVDALSGIRSIKAMAIEDRLGPMLQLDNDRLFRATRRQLISKEVLQALQEPLIVIFLATGVFLIAAYWVVPFDQLIMMGLLFQRTVSRLGALQSAYQQLSYNQVFYRSLEGKIAAAQDHEEVRRGTNAPNLRHEIRADHVFFGYDGKTILRNISVVVPAGQITAIHGPSGSGKTTFADLILGLNEPDQGAIFIDGVPLSEIDIRSWRREIGYVPQDLFLFHESVLNNFTLRDPEISREDAEQALRDAGAWDFVQALPQGLETLVGERGSKISGGQRQRIAIARALVRKPRLLILDEPTSALDPATEAAICRTLKQLSGQVTILAISHQPAIVEIADLVYTMRDGRATLAESGTVASVASVRP